jgi:hypothetical protein
VANRLQSGSSEVNSVSLNMDVIADCLASFASLSSIFSSFVVVSGLSSPVGLCSSSFVLSRLSFKLLPDRSYRCDNMVPTVTLI